MFRNRYQETDSLSGRDEGDRAIKLAGMLYQEAALPLSIRAACCSL